MSNSALAEIYFIAAMMILIFIICGVAVYFFFRTYKKEMAEKQKRIEKKIQNPKSKIQN
ncbi:MAG: hypothetical protein ACR2MG_04645 [Pyrinomonadaceae bacterium]